MDTMIGFTNFLFVPANRPERFPKAAASGADMICIDLEDSVPPLQKDKARTALIELFDSLEQDSMSRNPSNCDPASRASLDCARIAVRINGLKTAAGLADLLAFASARNPPTLIFIPMVESASEVEIAHSILSQRSTEKNMALENRNDSAPKQINGLIPLIETVKGLRTCDSIAASKGVTAMMFGGGDFSAELGTKLDWEPLLTARSHFIMGCASASIAAIDTPFIFLDDEAGLKQECQRAKALGFHVKAAIHPQQIKIIAAVMRSSAQEIAEAQDAIKAFERTGGEAIRYKGRMLEAPVVQKYRRLLAANSIPGSAR